MGCSGGAGGSAAAFELRLGDLLPELTIELTNDADLEPVDLSAAVSATLVMRHTDGSTIEVTGTLLTPLTAGKVKFTWVAGQTSKRGLYRCWIVVLFPNAKTETFPSKCPDDSDLTVRIC